MRTVEVVLAIAVEAFVVPQAAVVSLGTVFVGLATAFVDLAIVFVVPGSAFAKQTPSTQWTSISVFRLAVALLIS